MISNEKSDQEYDKIVQNSAKFIELDNISNTLDYFFMLIPNKLLLLNREEKK
jgi:hypothetical protein